LRPDIARIIIAPAIQAARVPQAMVERESIAERRVDPTVYLFAARAVRDFGDGFVAVLLPVYLLALGFSPLEVGVVATVSLLGSALLTIGVGFLGARHDHRQLLLAGASLMIATGVAFAVVHEYALLLIVAFAGTINPSAGSVSVFVPLEHAALAREITDANRTNMFARYSLVGALAGAVGALASATPDLVAPLGLDQRTAINPDVRPLCASRRDRRSLLFAHPAAPSGAGRRRDVRARPLAHRRLQAGRAVQSRCLRRRLRRPVAAGPVAVRAVRHVAVGGGYVLLLVGRALGVLVPRCRLAVAAHRAHQHHGVHAHPIQHRPDAGGLAPTLPLALALLLIRAALSQMDVPTRSSYVMAVVTERERAAAASFTSVPRSLVAAASPALAGALLAASHRAWPLLICGALKIVYDLLLLRQFRHLKPPEER
jgi:MFS family permease